MTLEEVLRTRNPWRTVLTEWEQQNLKDYKSAYGEEFSFNLGQSAKKFPVVSKTVEGISTLFTLIRNSGIVWCGPIGRFLCPAELALAQGFDIYKREDMTTSFAKEVDRSRSAWAGQIGNSMCAAAIGSVLSFGSYLNCVGVSVYGLRFAFHLPQMF